MCVSVYMGVCSIGMGMCICMGIGMCDGVLTCIIILIIIHCLFQHLNNSNLTNLNILQMYKG